MQVLANIDLNGNELQNVLLQGLASDPGSPSEQQIWYNTTDNVARYYDGTSVIDIGAGGLSIDLAAGEIIYGDGGGNEVAGTPDDAGIVAKTGNQTVAGAKTFSSKVTQSSGAGFEIHLGEAFARAVLDFNSLDFGAGAGALDWTLGRLSADIMQLGVNDRIRDTVDPAHADDLARKGYVDTKAPLASPVFTGNPTAPTPTPGDNDTSIATTGFVAAALAALVDAAPGTLDTLNELAAALGDDPNFATTVTNALATKTEKYTALVGDGVLKDFTINHALGTQWVTVQVYEVATMEQVMVDVELVDANNLELHFVGPTPASNSYRVVVIG